MLSVKYYRDKMTLLVKMDMKYEIFMNGVVRTIQ